MAKNTSGNGSGMEHDGTDAYDTGDHSDYSASQSMEAARREKEEEKKRKKREADAEEFKPAMESAPVIGIN